jgi:hypothetical protein
MPDSVNAKVGEARLAELNQPDRVVTFDEAREVFEQLASKGQPALSEIVALRQIAVRQTTLLGLSMPAETSEQGEQALQMWRGMREALDQDIASILPADQKARLGSLAG